LPVLMRRAASTAQQAGQRASFVQNMAYVARQPYARKVALLLTIAAATLTLADFVFKATVAESVEASELAVYFATIYFVLNVLSLGVQLVLVGWLLRRFDLAIALTVLPVLLLGGGVSIIAIGGLASALAIKGADGSLRYSLHRTATELLYVPLSEQARHRIKGFLDVVGQRGGQALASVAILSVAAFALPTWIVAAALIVLAALWASCAVAVRAPYLDLFRNRLSKGRTDPLAEFPELDVASLETIIASLDSDRDELVIAALEALERENKTRLVPALILYHPSEEVVLHALDLFTTAERTNVVPTIDRLLEHDSPRIRAAAVAARSVLAPDEQRLRMRLSLEDSPEVRATIMVNLIAMGAIVGSDAKDSLRALIDNGTTETKIGLAEAVERRAAAGFEEEIIRLAGDLEPAVRLKAMDAIGAVRSPEFVPLLVNFLADERTRAAARSLLLTFGDNGFDALREALEDQALHHVVRWRLPRALCMFAPEVAAPVLLRQLPKEQDGMVRYRIIRALELLVRQEPRLVLDQQLLDTTIRDTVGRAYRYLDRAQIMISGARAEESRATAGHALLVRLLGDKETNAVDRLFRLLGLRYRREDFSSIYRGLSSEQPAIRASSIELIESALPVPLRGAVIGLVDDIEDEQRLVAAGNFHKRLGHDYRGVLDSMLHSSSDVVQDFTAYHIGELRLTALYTSMSSLPAEAKSRADIARAIELLSSIGENDMTLKEYSDAE
jgi:AAA family ATP:ADP antiporter